MAIFPIAVWKECPAFSALVITVMPSINCVSRISLLFFFFFCMKRIGPKAAINATTMHKTLFTLNIINIVGKPIVMAIHNVTKV